MNLEEIEKQVRKLADIEEIKKLQVHYVNCLRAVNWEEIAECFTEDASINIGITGERRGKAQVLKLFKEEIGKRHIGKEYVFVVHPYIEVDGDSAAGTWTLYFMFTESDIVPVNSWTQGMYDCRYSRVDGQWKISDMKWKATLGPPPLKLMQMYGADEL